jgi:hypothetical protein
MYKGSVLKIIAIFELEDGLPFVLTQYKRLKENDPVNDDEPIKHSSPGAPAMEDCYF